MAKKKLSISGWVGLGTFAVIAVAAAIAAFLVVQQAPPALRDPLGEAVRKGPDSYFHHVFDPDKVLGMVGSVDLELDNFERRTTHGVLFAGLPSAPKDVPEFTMRAAEAWSPGVDGADNGVIVFIFTGDRRVRVEVGYGLEIALPDVEVLRLVETHLLPGLRAGDPLVGIEALAPALMARLESVPPAERPKASRMKETLIAGREIPRKARIVWGLWLANPPGPRIVLSTLAAAFLGYLALLVARIVRFAVVLVRRFLVRHDAGRRASAALDLTNAVLELARAGVIFFVITVGTSFFFPGTGSFGGGGVDVFF